MKKKICIDFDGVLHTYESGWAGADVVKDGPVEGAISWLKKMIKSDHVQPVIYSARSCQEGGIEAMKHFLIRNGLTKEELGCLEFPKFKPPAFLTIDDRCMTFTGHFPTFEEIQYFQPWNKKGV